MCKSQPTDDKLSLIGVWSAQVTHYKVLGAPIISMERLNLKAYRILQHHPSKIHMGYCFVRIALLLVLYAEICRSYNYSPAQSNRQCINLMRAKTCVKLLL